LWVLIVLGGTIAENEALGKSVCFPWRLVGRPSVEIIRLAVQPREDGTRTTADKREVIVAQGRPSGRKLKLSASGVSASANLSSCLCAVKLTPAVRTDRVSNYFARGWRHELNAGRAFLFVFWGILIFGYFVS
jgi:hypothetical protein